MTPLPTRTTLPRTPKTRFALQFCWAVPTEVSRKPGFGGGWREGAA